MTIFPDTNIYIHFQSIEYINWQKLTGVTEPVEIFIPLVIIQEIDKHKYSNRGTLAKKAQEVSNNIERWVAQTTNNKFKVTLDPFAPLEEFFKQYRLEQASADDNLIAAILAYMQKFPSKKIFLCTNDTAPRLKAATLKIQTIKPADSDRLSHESDVLEKENRELKRQLEKLKNLFPKLSVAFSSKDRHLKTVIREPEDWAKFVIAEEMAVLRRDYPGLKYTEPHNDNSLSSILRGFSGPTEDEVDTYNRELDDFYKEYEIYLRKIKQFDYKKNLTVALNIIVDNTGTCPAKDVDIQMHFPDGFLLLDKDGYHAPPPEPQPPVNPKAAIDPAGFLTSLPEFHPVIPDFSDLMPGRLKIHKTNSYDVSKSIGDLKHGFFKEFPVLYVCFDTYDTVVNFKIDYSISAANLPESVDGQLHVYIEKQDNLEPMDNEA